MRLYLSYGSNLCRRSMRIRCPDAKPVGKILLTNSRLVFRGVADVEYCPGSKTPCGIWHISQRDEDALDRYEGVNSGFYYKEYGIKVKLKGEEYNPLIYLMRSEGVYPPSQGYVDTLRRGYEDFQLDQSYLDDAIEHSYNAKSPDEQTRSRRQRQRKDSRHAQLVEMPEAVALKRVALSATSE